MSTRRCGLAALGSLLLSASVLLAWPAAADPPSREEQVIVHVNCMTQGAFGAAHLGLEHISTNRGAPGGDVRVWPPNADPDTDPPLLAGYSPEITRTGMTLTGDIPLRAGEDIVGWASYTVTFLEAGPTQVEEAKGALVEYDMRYNQQYRTLKERTPLTASGSLTLPGTGAVPLTACAGEEVVEHISITQPATVVGAGRYPFGFRDGEICQATSGGPTTALLALTGGEAAIVILRHGEEDAVAFGTVFPEMTRSTVTGSVPMFTPDGENLGAATLDATLRVVDRDNPHYRQGDTLHIGQVELVAADGVIVFDGVSYSFAGCEGVRARERTISR